jgi:ribosome-associated protein
MPTKPDTRDLATLCAELADLHKAENICVLDVRGVSSITDYFVLATGNNEPHVRAIWNEITRRIKELHSISARTPEGGRENKWVVVDYYDVVVQVMHRDQRSQYDLDGLWNDAPQVPLPFIEKATT